MKCSECGKACYSKAALEAHFYEEHGGEVMTDESDTRIESEQRDFEGNEPDTSGHNPGVRNTNDPVETKRTTIESALRENDDDITEYKNDEMKRKPKRVNAETTPIT